MPGKLLKVQSLQCSFAGSQEKPLFQDLDFELYEGDIVALTGKSGSGKTTLLKCLAHLQPFDGNILFRDQPAIHFGIPSYRTRVVYVPQRASLLPSTPRVFYKAIQTFSSRKTQVVSNTKAVTPIEVANAWGIDESLWDRDWNSLSGGEVQRIALAIAVGIGTAEVLLLDEPTSALDAATTSMVEQHLIQAVKSPDNKLKAMICITHSKEQAERLATRSLDMESIVRGNRRYERV